MNEKNQLRAFVLFLFLVLVLSVSGAAFAAIVVTPVPGGVTKVTSIPVGLDGHLRYQGQGAWNPITRSYSGTSSLSIGGKAATIANKIPLRAAAGTMAKAAMRANPYLLAGSLAGAWLLDQGFEWTNDGWVVEDTSGGTYPGGQLWRNNSPQGYTTGTAQGPYANQCGVTSGGCSIEAAGKFSVLVNVSPYGYPDTVQKISCTEAGWCQFSVYRGHPFNSTHTDNYQLVGTGIPAPSSSRPATSEDWDALPDPIPAVGPEIPNADWMPEGAPVDAPTHEPGNVVVGSPYKKPDGSTWQDGVTITPNNTTNNTWNTVTITNYSTKITEADGAPVADPANEETPDQQQDECEKRPDSVGCLDVGDLPEAETLPRSTVNIEFSPLSMPSNMSCPAPEIVNVGGHSIPIAYDAACYYAESLRPFVLMVAFLAGAYIIFGVRRGGES